jgi:hypothetical protein
MEVVKQITEEQLKRIKEDQVNLNNIFLGIGSLEAQKHALLHKLANVNAEVESFKKELEAEYGAININVEDGTYTSIVDSKE